MKLTYDDKLAIFRRKQAGVAWPTLSLEFGVREETLKYIVALMKRYGLEIVRKSPNRHYSTQLKLEIIHKVLTEGQSVRQTALDYALPSYGLLFNWLAHYKKNGYPLSDKPRGRTPKMGRKPKKRWEDMTELERLREENERLRTENVFLKKLRELRLKDEAEQRARQRQLEEWSKQDTD